MGKHYIVRKDGVVQLYHFKDEKRFRKNYVEAVPHRPRKVERRFKKRVRVYTRKIGVVYFSSYIVNAKGSGISEKTGAWSFTIHASIYTPTLIDWIKYEGLVDVSEALKEWLFNEFGFRNTFLTTVGGKPNQKRPGSDAEKRGFFIFRLAVEDKTMARGDYRLRRNLKRVNACMLVESCKRESYSVVNLSLVPRMAFRIRLCK